MSLFSGRSDEFDFPGNDDRTAIVGATGSGKSTFGEWLFAMSASFDKQPWILVDYKGEKLIQEILKNDDAELVDMKKPVPKHAGVYVVKPTPQEPELLLDYLWKIYARGKVGVFVDELMMVPKQFDLHNNPLQALLTQGRSKEIPMYLLTQRPSRVNISVFSEATYISEFSLNKEDDRKRVGEYIPDRPVLEYKGHKELWEDINANDLPRHWSKWWDSKRRKGYILRPSPDAAQILDIIGSRVHRMRSHQKI